MQAMVRTRRCFRHLTAALAAFVVLPLLAPPAAGDAIENSGTVLRFGIPAAAFALTLVHEDGEGRRQFYRSFATNVAATWLLKEIVDKERPDGSGDDAFPSGHATMAFQGASFIHRRYGLRTAWPAYALAAWTGWTRMESGEHDAADVLAGAAVGIASSFLFTDRFEDIDVAFRLDGRVGIQFSGRF